MNYLHNQPKVMRRIVDRMAQKVTNNLSVITFDGQTQYFDIEKPIIMDFFCLPFQ